MTTGRVEKQLFHHIYFKPVIFIVDLTRFCVITQLFMSKVRNVLLNYVFWNSSLWTVEGTEESGYGILSSHKSFSCSVTSLCLWFRAALQQQAAIRGCCNSFFLEVVSRFCLSAGQRPREGVVELLFSLLVFASGQWGNKSTIITR